ncbi:MAG: undecaprenyl-diphosphate phosphatase [Coriobacteriia bacterium]|nr:undecaprenyl-diphosphate phosphatase [Coriobacteriia bacterium]
MDIIEILKIILIGVVEGLTEWLPISSTGHMILLDEFIKLQVSEDFWNMFLVVIQLGAILAVVILYFAKLNPFSSSKSAYEKKETWTIWGKIFVGVLPAAILGLLLNDWMEEHLYNPSVVAAALIVYGIAFIVVEVMRERDSSKQTAKGAHFARSEEALDEDDALLDISYPKALGIGFFQVLSLVPGTSRSGSTILGGLILGTSRTTATEFSFFMAIPVMFGASLLKIVKFFVKGNTFSSQELFILGLGMFVALLVSILSIKFLLKFIKTNDFKPFGIYRIILGVLVIAYFIANGNLL